jgi:hypothetical protein
MTKHVNNEIKMQDRQSSANPRKDPLSSDLVEMAPSELNRSHRSGQTYGVVLSPFPLHFLFFLFLSSGLLSLTP